MTGCAAETLNATEQPNDPPITEVGEASRAISTKFAPFDWKIQAVPESIPSRSLFGHPIPSQPLVIATASPNSSWSTGSAGVTFWY